MSARDIDVSLSMTGEAYRQILSRGVGAVFKISNAGPFKATVKVSHDTLSRLSSNGQGDGIIKLSWFFPNGAADISLHVIEEVRCDLDGVVMELNP